MFKKIRNLIISVVFGSFSVERFSWNRAGIKYSKKGNRKNYAFHGTMILYLKIIDYFFNDYIENVI